MNQQQLAEKMGVSEATISRYESESMEISLGFLHDCAAVLNCTVADLVSRPPSIPIEEMLARAILRRQSDD